MLAGHFAVSLAAKRAAPGVSLGTLVAAAMASDLVWPLFTLMGMESVRFKAGVTRGVDAMDADIAYSHGLLTCVVLGVLLGAVYFWRRRDRVAAWVVGALVVSHWVLDWVSHGPDMALAPGVGRFGLGLWGSVGATVVVEGLMWVVGIAVYVRTMRARGKLGVVVFWGGVVLLTASWMSNITSPAPADVRGAMVSSFVFFCLMVGWGYWVERLSEVRQGIVDVGPRRG